MTGSTNRILRHLYRLTLPAEAPSDGELLEQYAARRDEAAFTTLLCRHGPMVLGVCRRILGNEQDAEDAFQATFLVLVRKVSSIRSAAVGSWLYGVARNTALRARTRRRPTEPLPELEAKDEVWREVRALLEEELGRIPEVYRAAVVLCDLEGRTIKESAALVGCPQGTLASRLRRGRELLADRLSRRGLVLPAAVVAAAVSSASAAVPTRLLESTLDAASAFAESGAAVISAPIAALTAGVLRAMVLQKLKMAVAVALVLAGLGVGVFSTRSAGGTAPSSPEPVKAGAKPVDNLRNTLLALDKHLWEASARGDWQERAKFYADDMVTISVLGKNGKAANVEADKRVKCSDWTVADAEVVTVSKDTAVLCYRYSCKITANDGTVLENRKDSRITYVWANRGGGWVIVFCFDDHGRKAGTPDDLRFWFKPNEWPAPRPGGADEPAGGGPDRPKK